jgi:hypothetical protein
MMGGGTTEMADSRWQTAGFVFRFGLVWLVGVEGR